MTSQEDAALIERVVNDLAERKAHHEYGVYLKRRADKPDTGRDLLTVDENVHLVAIIAQAGKVSIDGDPLDYDAAVTRILELLQARKAAESQRLRKPAAQTHADKGARFK